MKNPAKYLTFIITFLLSVFISQNEAFAEFTVDDVFVDFNNEFIPGEPGCNMPNPGFVSICGTVRQITEVATTIDGQPVMETGRPVEGAAVGVYLLKDAEKENFANTGKNEGRLTNPYMLGLTNEDGSFNIGIPAGGGKGGAVYVAFFCDGEAPQDLYVISTAENFVNFDVSLPCNQKITNPVTALPAELEHVNRSSYLSCDQTGGTSTFGNVAQKAESFDIGLEQESDDDEYSEDRWPWFSAVPDRENAWELLYGLFTQDTNYAVQDVYSTTSTIMGTVNTGLSSPTHPDYGVEENQLQECSIIECCFEGPKNSSECNGVTTQSCGNIGMGIQDPYRDKEVCTEERLGGEFLDKPVCLNKNGSYMTMGEFKDEYGAFPEWFCYGENLTDEVVVQSQAANDSYDGDDSGKSDGSGGTNIYVQNIDSVLPTDQTENFSLARGIDVASGNGIGNVDPLVAYLNSPNPEVMTMSIKGEVNSDLPLEGQGKYFRLGIGETLCSCTSPPCDNVKASANILSTFDPTSNPPAFRDFATKGLVKDFAYLTDHSNYVGGSCGDVTCDIGDFGVPEGGEEVSTTDSVFSEGEGAKDCDGKPPEDTDGDGVDDTTGRASTCVGNVVDDMKNAVDIQESPGAELAVAIKHMNSAFGLPFEDAPAMGGGYTIDIEANHEGDMKTPNSGKGKDSFFENALNGGVWYGDLFRAVPTDPVTFRYSDIIEPIFYTELDIAEAGACTEGQVATSLPDLPSASGACKLGHNSGLNPIPVFPPTMVEILEAAGQTYNVPPSLIVAVLFGEGTFKTDLYEWTEQNVVNWSLGCAVMPVCNDTMFTKSQWEGLIDAVNVVDPERTPNSCNLMDMIFAIAKDLAQIQNGSSAFAGKTCFGIPLNAGGGGSSTCSWDNSDIETAIRVWEFGTAYNSTYGCATKENSCALGGGPAANCVSGGDTCETIGNRYSQPSHNACLWDVNQNYK